MTDKQIQAIMEYGGYETTPMGNYLNPDNDVIDLAEVKDLLTDWNFVKSLESKMIEETSIVQRLLTKDTGGNIGITIDYFRDTKFNSRIIVGFGTTELEAILNAILNYLESIPSPDKEKG